MADGHIIAIDTYGAQRVTDPNTKKLVSAYKLGYTSAVTAVLLALYETNARDVSPKQASYRYLKIDNEVVVRHGHILLTLTADELAKTEQVTRQSHRAGVFLWRDQKWHTFPDSTHADFTEPGYRSGPTFDPTGFRPPSPLTGERESIITGIVVERSQREEGGKVWWWLIGETYPHRDLLKRHGARFSGKRKAWYYVGAELPAAIRALVTSEAQSDGDAPEEASASPLLTIFGGRIAGKEHASNGDIILLGENGIFATRTIWLKRNDQPETVWEFALPPQDRVGAPLPVIQKALQTNNAMYSLYTRKWHFEQPDKVAALDALAAELSFNDDEPCTVDEAAAILGLRIKETPVSEPPTRLFALDEIAYARHELETADSKPIPTGTRGKVVQLYNHNAKHGWSYDVDFENIGVCWCFERELTPHEPIPGIKIVRGAVVPPGASLPPTDPEIKRTLIPSVICAIEYRQQPTPIAPPPLVINSDPDGEPPVALVDDPPPAIRVIKPTPMPSDGEPLDAVQTAIREAKQENHQTLPVVHCSNGRIGRIEQSYVGELTGSITGEVFCFGYAIHDGIAVFINMAGPRMGVEAIRAKLSKGEQVSVVPTDAPAVELTAGEGNTGMYHPYLHYLPEARFASLLLVHDWAVTPLYGGKATTFIFRTSDAQATAKLKHHVTQLVNVPVFDVWSTYLYNAGQKARLVRKARSAGGIDLLSVDLDVDAWTRLITGGLEQQIIRLPELAV
jgi:hypothetical protein